MSPKFKKGDRFWLMGVRWEVTEVRKSGEKYYYRAESYPSGDNRWMSERQVARQPA